MRGFSKYGLGYLTEGQPSGCSFLRCKPPESPRSLTAAFLHSNDFDAALLFQLFSH